MNCRWLLAAALLGGCASVPEAPVEPHPDTPAYKWQPLFRSDLSDAELTPGGWKFTDDGVLVSVLEKPIWTKADWENYVLDFEYRMQKDGNSGVFIYISNLDKFPKYKLEVQLLDDESEKFKGKELPYQQTGSVYGRAAARGIWSKPAGEWNRMTIFCRGKDVHVVLNGRAVTDMDLSKFTDPLVNPDGTPVPPWHRDFPAAATIPTKGRVGFQGVHGEAGVELRNLRIASLGGMGGAVERRRMKLGCQMWSVREFWADRKDLLAAFDEIFAKVRAMGYEGVQSAAFLKLDAEKLEALLKKHGLEIADQPITLEDGENPGKLKGIIEFCRRFGVDFVYVPWYESKTTEGWREFCRRLDRIEENLRPYGIRVGYHQHTHELSDRVEGEFPWETLIAGARLEMDIGPVLDTGRVPAKEIARAKGRVPGIHAKPVGATAAGAPGEKQDWPRVVAAASKAGTKWFVVECEKRKFTYEDVEASAKYLKPLVDTANALVE